MSACLNLRKPTGPGQLIRALGAGLQAGVAGLLAYRYNRAPFDIARESTNMSQSVKRTL